MMPCRHKIGRNYAAISNGLDVYGDTAIISGLQSISQGCQQEIATRIVAQGATHLQEKKAAEAAERAVEEARELKEYRSQLTFKVCIFSLLWAQYLRE